jgi:hypothetical protein
VSRFFFVSGFFFLDRFFFTRRFFFMGRFFFGARFTFFFTARFTAFWFFSGEDQGAVRSQGGSRGVREAGAFVGTAEGH